MEHWIDGPFDSIPGSPGGGEAAAGACMALRGMEDILPFLLISAPRAASIRRLMLAHFREPLDVNPAPSGDNGALFVSGDHGAVEAAIKRYSPRTVGLVVCDKAAEAAPDNIASRMYPIPVARTVCSSSDSFTSGFHGALLGVLKCFEVDMRRQKTPGEHINIFPGPVSPADLRQIKEILGHYGLDYVMAPDYSESLDGPDVGAFEPVLKGGVRIEDLARMASARLSLTFGSAAGPAPGAGAWLEERFGVENRVLGLPVGLKASDAFFELLTEIRDVPIPEKHDKERRRLADVYVEAHKYLAGVRLLIHSWNDLAIGLASFLSEIGAEPVLVASRGRSGSLQAQLRRSLGKYARNIEVLEGVDYADLEALIDQHHPDLLISGSRALPAARHAGIPLLRVGFPVLDHLGGQRLLHLGYRGAQELFDRLVNTMIDHRARSESE